jgi:membrane dipeptidase
VPKWRHPVRPVLPSRSGGPERSPPGVLGFCRGRLPRRDGTLAHEVELKRLLPLVLVAALAAGSSSPSAAADEDAALRHARALLRKVPLVDGHNDTPWLIREDATSRGDVQRYDLRQPGRHETDLARLRAGGLSAQFWSVWIPSAKEGSARMQLEQIDIARRMVAAYPEALVFATRAADIEAAHRAGKIASFLGMENGRALENSLGTLRAYYDLGVRYLTLTHGRNTDWADSATDEPTHRGLTPFGREVGWACWWTSATCRWTS